MTSGECSLRCPAKSKTRAVLGTAIIPVPVCKHFSRLMSDFYWLALPLSPCGYGESAPVPNYRIACCWQAPFTAVCFAWWWKKEGNNERSRLIFKSESVKWYLLKGAPFLRHRCKQNLAISDSKGDSGQESCGQTMESESIYVRRVIPWLINSRHPFCVRWFYTVGTSKRCILGNFQDTRGIFSPCVCPPSFLRRALPELLVSSHARTDVSHLYSGSKTGGCEGPVISVKHQTPGSA